MPMFQFGWRLKQEDLYVVRPSDVPERIWYETDALYADEDANPDPCTPRSTPYTVNFVASLALLQVKRLLMRQPVFRSVNFSLNDFMFVVDK